MFSLDQRPGRERRSHRTIDVMLEKTSARIAARLAIATFVIACFVPVAPASAIGTLSAWWPLAEGRGQKVYDISGNGNHGFLGETLFADDHDPAWVRGRWGYALEFDGNDYIQIKNAPELSPQQLTVSLWFKGNGSPGTYRYLLSKGGSACVSASYAIETGFNGGLWFYVWNGEQQRWSGGVDASVWDGKWHHVAGTFDGVNVKMYLDGREVPGGSNLRDVVIDYDLEQQDAVLGAYRAGCELMFAGALDQVSIWSKAYRIDQIWGRWGWFLGTPNS